MASHALLITNDIDILPTSIPKASHYHKTIEVFLARFFDRHVMSSSSTKNFFLAIAFDEEFKVVGLLFYFLLWFFLARLSLLEVGLEESQRVECLLMIDEV